MFEIALLLVRHDRVATANALGTPQRREVPPAGPPIETKPVPQDGWLFARASLLNRKEQSTMRVKLGTLLAFLLVTIPCARALANDDEDTVKVFREAGESSKFFDDSYGYVVFPSIAKGGLGVGAAHGDGGVYVGGKLVGKASMTQVSVGLQAGGEAFRQIIFLKDKKAFDDFTSGNFEFGAEANAVAITAGASAGAGTTGASGSASGGEHNASTSGGYHKGMAVFTVAKGGLMYQATIGGQKFKYTPLK
jgi:hypothetical protein